MTTSAETKTLFSETFDQLSGTGGNDGSFSGVNPSAVSSSTAYDESGWSMTQGYVASKCVKMGSGSKKGTATTPTISFEAGKTYTLTFKAGAWNGNSEQTTLTLSTTAGTLSATSVTLTKGAFTDYTLTLTATGEGTISFEGKQAKNSRFFLDEVKVTYDDGAAARTATKTAFETSAYTYLQSASELSTFEGQTATLTDGDGNAINGTLSYTSDNTDVATVDTESGKVSIVTNAYGKAKITASFAGDDTYSESSAYYTINITQELTPSQANTELDKESYNKETVRITGIVSKIDEISTSYGNATYYISDDGTTEGQLEVYRGYGVNGEKFTDANALHVGDKVVLEGTLTIYNSTKEVNSNSKIITLTCPHEAVTVGSTGYATLYYGEENLEIPSGVTAYTVTMSESGNAKLNEYSGTVIAKGTGVVLSADAGTYYFAKKESAETAATAENLLKGSDEAATTAGGDVYYKLSLNAAKEEGSVGFYYGAEDGAAFTNGAHKAYLALTKAQAGNIRAFLFNGETVTGINAATTAVSNNEKAYDLQGRRVQNLGKGLYIVNGKKVIKK